jgi:hypothetical protein
MKKFFPDSFINTIDANGNNLTSLKKGAWVELFENDGKISGAEIYSEDHDEYGEIGLFIENNELLDYDGVFFLPKEVISMLKERGINTEEMENSLDIQ